MRIRPIRTIALLWSAVMALTACDYHPRYKDDFYNHNMSDVSPRLPLVRPYELLKDPTRGKKEDLWEINLHRDVKFPVVADTVYVDPDRYIAGYGSMGTLVVRGETSAYMMYFIVDLKKGREQLFYDLAGFRTELKKCGVNWSDLTPTNQIYSKYQETGLLPWLSPQK